jgi:hypothetical protein
MWWLDFSAPYSSVSARTGEPSRVGTQSPRRARVPKGAGAGNIDGRGNKGGVGAEG